MVSSVKDSNVYVLRYTNTEREGIGSDGPIAASESSRVISQKLDTVNRAADAAEILRDVLGVKTTMPEWAEEELAAIVARYRGKEINRAILLASQERPLPTGLRRLVPRRTRGTNRRTMTK